MYTVTQECRVWTECLLSYRISGRRWPGIHGLCLECVCAVGNHLGSYVTFGGELHHAARLVLDLEQCSVVIAWLVCLTDSKSKSPTQSTTVTLII